MTTSGFGTSIASKISGLSIRQLDYYDRTGLVKPSVKPAEGYGSRRLYSFKDIVELKTVGALRNYVSLQKIRRALTYLHKNFPDIGQPLSELKFLSDGETVFVLTSNPETMVDALHNGQVVISLAFGRIIEEVRSELEKTKRTVTQKVKIKGNSYTIDYVPDLEDGGYTATCREIKGAISQGDNIEEAREMITDAITMIQDLLLERQAEFKAKRAKR